MDPKEILKGAVKDCATPRREYREIQVLGLRTLLHALAYLDHGSYPRTGVASSRMIQRMD